MNLFAREFAVKVPDHIPASLCGFGESVEAFTPDANPVLLDGGLEFPSRHIERDTVDAGFVASRERPILHVLAMNGGTQIAPPIVASVSVSVIDFKRRPFARHPEPRQTVRHVSGRKLDRDVDVSSGAGSRLFPGPSVIPIGMAVGAIPPSEDAGSGIVIENRAQLRGGKRLTGDRADATWCHCEMLPHHAAFVNTLKGG